MTYAEEMILRKRIEELEKHQKEQDKKIEYLDNLIKVLTDGLAMVTNGTI